MNVRRVYESTIIVNAALEDNDIDAVINKITTYLENHGGVILEIDKWGRKRLAYPINKKYNGYYVHIVFETLPVNLPILERFFVLEDTVLRHLTLVLSDKLRQQRKEKALAEGHESGTKLISGTDTVPAKTEEKQVEDKETEKEVEKIVEEVEA
ncbi:MAG: 30S ribosomal protein S6 [Candidatus Kapabacteria bacterium]|nr:30S ribosomal protein S6 [Ignavibacteriota bacterium]MCW5884048.1 30S ribosomal protein S6 [Candidatus Kapabacteria bacterium]